MGKLIIKAKTHRTVTFRPAPKPTKPAKKKSIGAWWVCPRCGAYGRGEVSHFSECPQDFLIKKYNKRKTPSQLLDAALEIMCKEVVFWRDRDHNNCVMDVYDGNKCGGGRQWGHVLARTTTRALKYDLGNTAAQCSNHNLIHPHDPIFYDWYRLYLGNRAYHELEDYMREHQGEPYEDVQRMDDLTELNRLYDERDKHIGDSLAELVDAGYYGDIVKQAWIKDGKL